MSKPIENPDEQAWRQIRHGAPGADESISRYDQLLQGEGSADLVNELIALDPELARLLKEDAAPVSVELRQRILSLVATGAVSTNRVAVPRHDAWTRWGQWSSLAASLLLASSAGLYLGRSVGNHKQQSRPKPIILADDMESFGLEALFPTQQGDS
jgi:hypothetical protein